ncbi:MAG: cation:proton antiporter, partial [Pseudomonadales bacterium]|nr:cation:proton antiporter [Pseudomonadales bacterium]
MNEIYIPLATLMGFIFCYSLIAKRVESSFVSGPMIFTAVGFLLGNWGLGVFGWKADSNDLRLLADMTLALVLFADAANANLSVLRRHIKIPSRMLLIGLPGVILFGFIVAAWMFDQLSIYEAAILATMLAATDAALGKAVITDKNVPARIREGLNAESGFNDGLCVPILLLLIALAASSTSGEHSETHALLLVAEELGIGLAVGLILAAAGAFLLQLAKNNDWLCDIWLQSTVAALAITSFAVAQQLHGSGYIAAFSGGLLFGHLAKEKTHQLLMATEGAAEVLALMTWILFGAAVIAGVMELLSWQVVAYSLLSLTIIRMLPIYLAFTGSDVSPASRLFMGWFGPRGLASLVFVIIVMDAGIAGGRF